MKKNYSGVWRGLAIIIAAVIYSIILFTFKKSFDLASWLAYGYTIMGFLVLLIGTCFLNRSEKTYPMFDLTTISLTIIYFCIQFVLGGIGAMVMTGLSPLIVALAGFVLLAIYVVAVLLLNAMTSSVQGQDDTDGKKAQTWQLLVAEIDTINMLVTERQLQEKLSILRNTLRYSDPIGEKSLSDLEGRIRHNISLLHEEAIDGENEKISVRIDKLQRLLIERNNKCKALKK